MIRIATLLLVALLSYFGLTFLIEFKKPEVKDLTSEEPSTLAMAPSPPEVVLGHFNIDQAGSQKWLGTQKHLNIHSIDSFTNNHIEQTELGFNGESIWFSDAELVYPVKIKEVTDLYVSFIIHQPDGSQFTAYLQWDSKGALWYSHYNLLQDGKKQLYRARYVRGKAQ